MLTSENAKGFTLIELMIVVAIIGLLAAIAVPNFIAYRNKGRISANIETANTTRSALGGYASTNALTGYPTTSDIPDWPKFSFLCNRNGAVLNETLAGQGLSYFEYHGVSSSGTSDDCDNIAAGKICADYCYIMRVAGTPHDLLGSQIEVRSSGIFRQTY